MNLTLFPSQIKGTLNAPASKSVLIRAIAAACLSEGETHITGYSPSDDVSAAIRCGQSLCAIVEEKDNALFIQVKPFPWPSATLHCGESGLCARLFSCIAALGNAEMTIAASGTLLKRPIKEISGVLTQAGVSVNDNNGFLPLKITGPLQASSLKTDGSGSSQHLSGLLMTLPLLNRNSEIVVENLKSKPYIDLTLDVMKEFGVNVTHENYSHFNIEGNQKYTAAKFHAEGDWSATAFLLVAGAIAGEVTVKNISLRSFQADKKIVEALQMAGAAVKANDDKISVSKTALKSFSFDATDCPDLFPPLLALAACCEGVSEIKGVDRLFNKESNRAVSLSEVLLKLGVPIEQKENSFFVTGSVLKGNTSISSHHDHRVAMMAAVLSLRTDGPVLIENAECVEKSWPAFWDDLIGLQAE
ncbi:MAG: 3-phosphoshikimate 1-carboxyvinyltransferase [Bacteroidota bacterium]